MKIKYLNLIYDKENLFCKEICRLLYSLCFVGKHTFTNRSRHQHMDKANVYFWFCGNPVYNPPFCQSFRAQRISGFWRIQSKKYHIKWESCPIGFLSGQ